MQNVILMITEKLKTIVEKDKIFVCFHRENISLSLFTQRGTKNNIETVDIHFHFNNTHFKTTLILISFHFFFVLNEIVYTQQKKLLLELLKVFYFFYMMSKHP